MRICLKVFSHDTYIDRHKYPDNRQLHIISVSTIYVEIYYLFSFYLFQSRTLSNSSLNEFTSRSYNWHCRIFFLHGALFFLRFATKILIANSCFLFSAFKFIVNIDEYSKGGSTSC